MSTRRIGVFRLGRIGYADALELQRSLQRARQRAAIGDRMLLLEHPKVITMGRAARDSNLLFGEKELERLGYELHRTGRGGDVTYHGPGQVVAYPILDLKPDRKDVRRYVNDLEEIMIRTCADYDVQAERIEGMNGTWLRGGARGDRKIGAIGVRISRWVTMHGFALNVNTTLTDFGAIVPCGLVGKGVTSLRAELDREVAMDEVMDRICHHAAEVFDAEVQTRDGEPLDGVAAEAYAPERWETGAAHS